MLITVDTENLTNADREILVLVLGGAVAAATIAKPAPAPAKKAAAAKPAPEPEPEEEDLFGADDDDPVDEAPTLTREDAVAAATKLVSEGKSAEVKKALTSVGAKRVSEIPDAAIAKFIKALA